MNTKKIGVGSIILMLLFFMAMPVASANVYLNNFEVGYDIDQGYFGRVEYKYTENTLGFVLIVIDDEATELISVQSGSWKGIRKWKLQDFYFSLNQSVGIHNITAIALNVENSMSTSYSAEERGTDTEANKVEARLMRGGGLPLS